MSPYQVLHLLLHHGLSPYFEAYARNQETIAGAKPRADTETKTGIPGTKKKFAELELGLMHLQQNVEIPALNLPMHDVVQGALKEAEAKLEEALAGASAAANNIDAEQELTKLKAEF